MNASSTVGQQPNADDRELRLSDIKVVEPAILKRAVGAASLGNAMEWFDFGIYSYLAVTLGKVFFPDSSSSAQLLATFAAFAVAFIMRPLGGLFFGPLGDHVGRQRVLAATMILMAISTFCIGLIPSYATIGVWSPVLLLVARMVQGFSTGGEYGGAATFIAEYSPDRKRGLMGSWLEFGTLGGFVLAAVIVTSFTLVLTDEQMLAWGWRIPFFIAGPLGIIGLYLRMRLEDTPAFKHHQQQHANEPLRREFKSMISGSWKAGIICIGLVFALNVSDYIILSYLPSYLSAELGYNANQSLVLILIVMLIMMAVQPLVGTLSDRVGRRPIILVGCSGFVIAAVPCFMLIQMNNMAATFAGILVLGLLLNCFLGTMPSALPALFPTRIRYGALAICYNISTSLFGGTAPLLTTWLTQTTHNLYMPAFYLSLAAAVCGVTVMYTLESARRPLQGSTPTASSAEEAEELLREHSDMAGSIR
ncbi:Proline/betaine transporter [Carnimonas sp. R-84981]|uniref:glycine betaine/L-proline transporter ProP n=1 Tax=Carnimonas bestiolae TaxID=3402172 RepID=UPI003EDC677C